MNAPLARITPLVDPTSPPVDTLPLATSGTVGQTRYDLAKLFEHAYRRCGVPQAAITSEYLDIGRECLYLATSNLANKGLLLWTIERVIMGLYPNTRLVYLPIGTVDVKNANYRVFNNRFAGTISAPVGTTTPGAIVDGTLSGNSVQLLPNGYFQADYGSAGSAVQVTTFGFVPYGDQYYTLNLQTSPDAVTWTTQLSLPQTLYSDGVWSYFDIDGLPTTRYVRVVETGGGTLSLRQLLLGNTPSDIPMALMNRDDYAQLVNPLFNSGGRSLQYYFDKQALQPVMVLWPVPSDPMASLEIYRTRHIQDPGDFTLAIDAPQRWHDALTWITADYMAAELPDSLISIEKRSFIEKRAARAEVEAWGRESDNAPVNLTPDISAYTR